MQRAAGTWVCVCVVEETVGFLGMGWGNRSPGVCQWIGGSAREVPMSWSLRSEGTI